MLPPLPSGCAATEYDGTAAPPPPGWRLVQVWPRSWLTSSPQSSPTNASLVLGAKANDHESLPVPQVAAVPATRDHVAPPLALRQTPPWLVTEPSDRATAMTTDGAPGA